MKRLILPLFGVLAAAWAVFSVARTHPVRERTEPPASPPISEFRTTVAAEGIVEASTENISAGTPLSGVVARVFVTAGQPVRAGAPLFKLDPRHLEAARGVRQQAVALARTEALVAESHLADVREQFEFVNQLKDKRAVSVEETTRRRSAVETASAELEAARARVAAAQSELHAVD